MTCLCPAMTTGFELVAMFDEAGNAIEPEIPPGWRYATPEEVIDRGFAGDLARSKDADIRQVLRDMVDLGMVDENGEPITDVYEAALYLTSQMSVTPSLSSVLM